MLTDFIFLGTKEEANIQLELGYKTSAIGQNKYLTTTTDSMLLLILLRNKRRKAHSISKQSYKFKQELNIH